MILSLRHILLLLCVLSITVARAQDIGNDSALPAYCLKKVISHNLGPYSARYPVHSFGGSFGIDPEVPDGCQITQVNILQRHGARFPTDSTRAAIEAALSKIRAANDAHPGYINNTAIEFMLYYNTTFGTSELVDFGRDELFFSGVETMRDNPSLAEKGVFVRTTDVSRVFESSRWFKQGFAGGPRNISIESLPNPDIVIKTGPMYNNTLAAENCVAREIPEDNADMAPDALGITAADKWLEWFASPIGRRLNAYVPGLNLNVSDVKALMSLCGFETALHSGEASPWCHVFYDGEWQEYEYWYDLDKYWRNAYGSATGRAEGSGWVNELLARLTGQPVRLGGAVNSTLDEDPITFPLPPAAPFIFADFSSDNNIVRIISALGILRDNIPLSEETMSQDRLFVVSKTVPFSGKLVVDKLSCGSTNLDTGIVSPGIEISLSNQLQGQFVRILLNGGVVPLDFPACSPLGVTHGLCSLSGFLESQDFSENGGEWDQVCT